MPDALKASHEEPRRVTTGPTPVVAGETAAGGRGHRDMKLLAVVVTAVLALVLSYWMLTGDRETTDNAQIEADVLPLRIRIEGRVERVAVAENARVEKGDPLIELERREYAIQARKAEAELALARAQAMAADAQIAVVEAAARGDHFAARARVSASQATQGGAEAEVTSARAQVGRAEVEARRAASELARTEKLHLDEVVSQVELDNAQAAEASARAALDGERAELAAADRAWQAAFNRVDEARGQLDQSAPVEARIAAVRANSAIARARVEAAEAELARTRLVLENTLLRAPADGVVARLSVHQGQVLSAGQTVAHLVPSRMYVIANFKETQVGSLAIGQRAEVAVDAFPGRRLRGQVESFSSGTGSRFSLLPPDNASGNYVKVVQRVPVRITLAEVPEDITLRAGLSAVVTVFESQESEEGAAPPSLAGNAGSVP